MCLHAQPPTYKVYSDDVLQQHKQRSKHESMIDKLKNTGRDEVVKYKPTRKRDAHLEETRSFPAGKAVQESLDEHVKHSTSGRGKAQFFSL